MTDNNSKLLTALKTTVYKQLTQNVRSTDADSDIVARHHRDLVDQFINEFLTPVLESETGKFEIDRLGNYFKVFLEGKMSQRENKVPFVPFGTENSFEKVVSYLETLEMEDYYNHSRDFIQGCFVIISNWFRNVISQNRVDTIYNVLPPHEWYNAVVKSEQDEAKNISMPDNVKTIMTRIKVYGTLNF